MKTYAQGLEEILQKVDCEYRLGQQGLDCLEAFERGVRVKGPLCSRCKVKKRLDEENKKLGA
jgi:hypothetical protein